MIGLHLAQYRIDAELGRGGMGIVYRATDTKLNRTVALKVLPASALSSEEDRARFFREAQAAAQLHHPHIATVFQIDEAVPVDAGQEPAPGSERRPFIAMEFIEGETLERRITQGPLKLDEAVGIARQVAEALRAAHAKQIVHRDIKAANVMLTADGTAKVLDFGLAKTQASTQLTRQGSTLGTVAYMSPEQARGLEVDGRSDLYSLGTVLYEMVAGRRPFVGDYEQALVYGILNEDPEPLTAVRTGVPMGLEWIVNKLLAKEVRHRYQSAADLVADLETVDLSGSGFSRSRAAVPAASPGRRAGFAAWQWGAAVVVALVAGLLAGRLSSGAADAPVRSVTASVVIPDVAWVNHPSISPDGRWLAFSASGGRLLLYDFEDGRRTTLVENADVRVSRFSPDSRWLVFEHGQSGLSLVQVPGGTVARLSESCNVPSWLDDEWVLCTVNGGLAKISRITQQTVAVRGPDEPDGWIVDQATVLPGGRRALVAYGGRDTGVTGIALMDLSDGSLEPIRDGAVGPRYLASGHLVFTAVEGAGVYTGRVFVQPFDPSAGAVRGPAVPMLSERGYWEVGTSETGHLVTTAGMVAASDVTPTRLVRVDPVTGSQVLLREDLPGVQGGFDVSADGTWIAVARYLDNRLEVGPLDPDEGAALQFTASLGVANPRFLADGESVLYSAGLTGGNYWIYRQPLDGSASGTRVNLTGLAYEWMLDVSVDTGRALVVAGSGQGPESRTELMIVDIDGGNAQVVSALDEEIDNGSLSPDGRWVAFTSGREATGSDLVVRGVDGTGPWTVGRGIWPQWMPDGRSIVYRTERDVVLQELSMDRGVRATGPPRVLYSGSPRVEFRVDRTTGTVLVADVTVAQDNRLSRIDVVLDWSERLKRDVPVP